MVKVRVRFSVMARVSVRARASSGDYVSVV